MKDQQLIIYRNIFLDISKGFSVGTFQKKKVKIKHLGLEDQAIIDSFRQTYFQRAIRSGIPTENQRLEILNKKGFWTKTDEDKVISVKSFIQRLHQTLNKTVFPSAREALEQNIKNEQSKLNELLEEKDSYVGKTAEIYADKKLNEYFLFYSIRKFDDINTTFFSEDEFDNLENTDINELTLCFNETVGNINSNNIKKIALQPFFQNYFYLTDSIAEFWDKKILELTIFQSDLSYWARYFKKIIQNSENPIPQEILSDPDELLKFMNLNSEAQKTLAGSSGELGASSNPNMRPEDYQKLGIKPENPESVWVRKKFDATGKKFLTGREVAELRQTGQIKKWDE